MAAEKACSMSLSSVYNQVFWKGCLPGSQGNLCKVCMGGTGEAATKRCADNHNERYYGNMGALRYLAQLPVCRGLKTFQSSPAECKSSDDFYFNFDSNTQIPVVSVGHSQS